VAPSDEKTVVARHQAALLTWPGADVFRAGIAPLVVCCALAPGVALAQAWRIEPELRATVTATDNSGYTDSIQAKGDVIVNIAPRLNIRGRGAQYRIRGDFGLDALEYASNTQPGRVLPSGRLSLESELIDRWLYLDGVLLADQTADNPYSARADGGASFNRVTLVDYRVSPYLKHSFGADTTVLVRADLGVRRWLGEYRSDLGEQPRKNEYTTQYLASFENRADPLGGSLEFSSQRRRIQDEAQQSFSIDSARVVPSYALDPQFTLSLVAGAERSKFAASDVKESIAGLRVVAIPTARTDIKLC
jgi:uncharacterized protein (PEP-CTERM system associated)